MVEDRIGYRYAKSAFALAEEKNIVEETREDMGMIANVISSNREFAAFLKSPLISSSKKLTIVNEIFGGNYKSELAEMLVQLVVRKGREMYLPQVAESFLRLYDEAKKILRGVLTSAVPLSSDQMKKIKASMEEKSGKTFEMESEVNPELIGGFVLKVGDTLFDGSVASSLRKLNQEFSK